MSDAARSGLEGGTPTNVVVQTSAIPVRITLEILFTVLALRGRKS